jgi:hypothetical protein
MSLIELDIGAASRTPPPQPRSSHHPLQWFNFRSLRITLQLVGVELSRAEAAVHQSLQSFNHSHAQAHLCLLSVFRISNPIHTV